MMCRTYHEKKTLYQEQKDEGLETKNKLGRGEEEETWEVHNEGL